MKQVLVIDDSEPVRKRIAALLGESPQIQIVGEAGTATEGWQIFQKSHPGIVVLDIQLPDDSGIHLLKQIKADYPEGKSHHAD